MDATIIHRMLKFVAFNRKEDQPKINGNNQLEGVIPPSPVLFCKAAEIY
jgi:hypothetical protein